MLDCLFVDFNAPDERLQYLGSEPMYLCVLLGVVDELPDTFLAYLHLVQLRIESAEFGFYL